MDSSIDALVESSRVQFDEQAALLFRGRLRKRKIKHAKPVAAVVAA